MAVLNAIQRGTVTLANGSKTISVALTSVDPAKTLVFVTQRGIGYGQPGPELVKAYLESATSLKFDRWNNNNAVELAYEVAEFTSGVAVQRGWFTTDGTTGETARVVTLSPAVDRTKAFVLLTLSGKGTAYNATSFVRAEIAADGASVTFNWDDAALSRQVSWQVVEYDDLVVQHGPRTLDGAETSDTAGPSPSVNPDKAVLFYSWTLNGAHTPSTGALKGVLTDGSTITLSRNATGSLSTVSQWSLGTFTDGTTVQRGVVDFASADTSKTLTLASAVDTAQSVIVLGGFGPTFGSSAFSADDNYAAATATVEFTNSTTVTLRRDKTGAASSFPVQVISFRDAAVTAVQPANVTVTPAVTQSGLSGPAVGATALSVPAVSFSWGFDLAALGGSSVATIPGWNFPGRTLYVNAGGSDSNSGLSEAAPLKTVMAAVRKWQPGDKILLNYGDNFTTEEVRLDNKQGTVSAAGYLGAYGDASLGRPGLKYNPGGTTNPTNNSSLRFDNGTCFWLIENLRCYEADKHCVHFFGPASGTGPHDIFFNNCLIDRADRCGIYMENGDWQRIYFNQCDSIDNGLDWVPGTGDSTYDGGAQNWHGARPGGTGGTFIFANGNITGNYEDGYQPQGNFTWPAGYLINTYFDRNSLHGNEDICDFKDGSSAFFGCTMINYNSPMASTSRGGRDTNDGLNIHQTVGGGRILVDECFLTGIRTNRAIVMDQSKLLVRDSHLKGWARELLEIQSDSVTATEGRFENTVFEAAEGDTGTASSIVEIAAAGTLPFYFDHCTFVTLGTQGTGALWLDNTGTNGTLKVVVRNSIVHMANLAAGSGEYNEVRTAATLTSQGNHYRTSTSPLSQDATGTYSTTSITWDSQDEGQDSSYRPPVTWTQVGTRTRVPGVLHTKDGKPRNPLTTPGAYDPGVVGVGPTWKNPIFYNEAPRIWYWVPADAKALVLFEGGAGTPRFPTPRLNGGLPFQRLGTSQNARGAVGIDAWWYKDPPTEQWVYLDIDGENVVHSRAHGYEVLVVRGVSTAVTPVVASANGTGTGVKTLSVTPGAADSLILDCLVVDSTTHPRIAEAEAGAQYALWPVTMQGASLFTGYTTASAPVDLKRTLDAGTTWAHTAIAFAPDPALPAQTLTVDSATFPLAAETVTLAKKDYLSVDAVALSLRAPSASLAFSTGGPTQVALAVEDVTLALDPALATFSDRVAPITPEDVTLTLAVDAVTLDDRTEIAVDDVGLELRLDATDIEFFDFTPEEWEEVYVREPTETWTAVED